MEHVLVVLDWNVRLNTSCEDAKKMNSSTDNPYLCQSNTECIDTDMGAYRCSCLPGYEDNFFYLKSGCTGQT
ncbi:Wall-associated receptor kinase 5 [Bienertia sinuspersici]